MDRTPLLKYTDYQLTLIKEESQPLVVGEVTAFKMRTLMMQQLMQVKWSKVQRITTDVEDDLELLELLKDLLDGVGNILLEVYHDGETSCAYSRAVQSSERVVNSKFYRELKGFVDQLDREMKK